MKNDFPDPVRKFGLLGRNISYSFSRNYFRDKFEKEQIRATYQNFDIEDISELKRVLQEHPDLCGFNITIPYKEQILPYLDEIDSVADTIGAVNTVKVLPNGNLKGYNTDYYGFSEALKSQLGSDHWESLVLGTGGASKAIVYALKKLDIVPVYVSRTPGPDRYSYEQLDGHIMEQRLVIVNCTPLGTSPNTEAYPPIPVEYITDKHLIFDLIYNPPTTRLMELAAAKGAKVSNGLKMLELQADKSWEHWNEPI